MPDYYTLESRIEKMIDELQGLCSQNGLSNTAAEEVVITSVFLYKFLNDKFMYNLRQYAGEIGETPEEVLKNENDELYAFYDTHSQDVAFRMEDTIEALINQTSKDNFAEIFDDALERISNYERNDLFKIETADGAKEPLFTRITENVEKSARKSFAVSIFSIISTDKFDFSGAYVNNFDFYSSIFEHLIKNYNVASGTYAEYYTPQSVSSIISKCLVGMSEIDEDKLYDIYDAAAGSGSLILHLANDLGKGKFGNKARIYTQDVSQKSSRFLRINMMLNGLTESLGNIVRGDTLLNPAQYNIKGDPASGYRKFDYITINPPFKMDFSSSRDSIEHNWAQTDRFFAGIPKVPGKKKESMAIYLCFIQHVLWSLKDNGKAAIVLPTGFLTAQSGIESTVRQKLIDNNWLQGAISMPSNIFANTGTNVSVIFIDKTKSDDKITFIDASTMGEKRKEGKNQRTVLRPEEIEKIINTFVGREQAEDFSVVVTKEDVVEKNYSFSAGQYFEVKIEYQPITEEEFNERINKYKEELYNYKQKHDELFNSIASSLERINHGK
jgi:type I restriction enzyme M protein